MKPSECPLWRWRWIWTRRAGQKGYVWIPGKRYVDGWHVDAYRTLSDQEVGQVGPEIKEPPRPRPMIADSPRVPELPNVPPEVRPILQAVAEGHQTTVSSILGQGRSRTVVSARHRAMQGVRELGWSTPEIGRLFNRNHTSVLHALKKAA